MALQARVADLEQQVNRLQLLISGAEGGGLTDASLEALYWEACRSYTTLNQRDVFLWETLIHGLTVRHLLHLARRVQDPFPWKPFLVLFDHATHAGCDVDAATAHVLACAQELLNLQGLWVLVPADLMGKPLAIQEAVTSMGD